METTRADGPTVGRLVAEAAAGDQRAYEQLVREFSGLVWAVCRAHRLGRADAEDVSQTTWFRFVEHLGRLQEPERAGAWLATTARHECLAVLRRQGRAIPTEDGFDEQPSGAPDVDASLLRTEERRAVAEAFAELGEPCASLLRLLFAEPRLPYEEIAALVGRPIGSLGPTRKRCLGKLAGHPAIVRIRSRAEGSVTGEEAP